jgi:large subunit ribosomal protein L28
LDAFILSQSDRKLTEEGLTLKRRLVKATAKKDAKAA